MRQVIIIWRAKFNSGNCGQRNQLNRFKNKEIIRIIVLQKIETNEEIEEKDSKVCGINLILDN